MESIQQNKVAIVTGGGSGIGLAIAEKFVQQNITTIIVGRDKQKLESAVHALGSLCVPFCFDLNELQKIPSLVDDIIKHFGRIDMLVNNAGINMKKEFTCWEFF